MRCPFCPTKLLAVDRDGVEVDLCPGCRGLWLDGGEIDAIADRHRLRDRARDRGHDADEDAFPAQNAGGLVCDAIFRGELRIISPEELHSLVADEPCRPRAEGGPYGDAIVGADVSPQCDTQGKPVPLCPVCDVALTVSYQRRVRLDVCSNCRGIWFDAGELERVLKRNAGKRRGMLR